MPAELRPSVPVVSTNSKEGKLVIIATGSGDEETAARAMQLGVCDYVIKDPERKYLKLLPHRIDAALRNWRSEVQLRESEARYRDLFENASDLIQAVAPDGQILYVNRAWKTALGYTDADLAGLNLFQVIHADEHEHCRELMQRMFRGENIGVIETRFVSRTGQCLLVEGTTSCQSKDGRPFSTRGIFRDVTSRRQAEAALRQSEERFAKVFRSSPVAISISSLEDGKLIDVNDAFLVQMGYERGEVLGRAATELGLLLTQDAQETFFQRLRESGSPEVLREAIDRWFPPGATSPISATDNPRFDWNGLLKDLGGDRAGLANLLKLFLETAPPFLTRLHASVEADDREALIQTAHTLKGCFAQLGLAEARQAAATVEESGRASSRADIRGLVAELDRKMQQACAEVRSALESTPQ